jgi:hypothetical protein
MRYAGLALVVGMLIPGAAILSAQDWRDIHHDRQDLRSAYRDIHLNYDRMARERADLAADRARLNAAINCGRPGAAAYVARDIARDRARLKAQFRDIGRDQYDAHRDRQDIRHDYWGR